MSINVNMHEAKSRLSELVAAALRGEDVVLARAGKPVVRLVPTSPVGLTPEQITAKRVAAFGKYAEKYRQLHGTDALTVPPSMTDEEVEQRFQRKFASPAD
jgi:prevent-host-death family protein